VSCIHSGSEKFRQGVTQSAAVKCCSLATRAPVLIDLRQDDATAFADHAGEFRLEEVARRIAWAAAKRSYVKVGNSSIVRHP
jgi:hypothetical protein